jgi:hypothetical protein
VLFPRRFRLVPSPLLAAAADRDAARAPRTLRDGGALLVATMFSSFIARSADVPRSFDCMIW